MDRKAPDLPRLDRLEDHLDREQVRHVADDHPADRQQPPEARQQHDGEHGHRYAEREAEPEPEVDDEPQLLPAHVLVDAVGQLRVLLELPDHHQLDVEQLVDVLAYLVGDVLHDLGKLLLDPLVHGLAELRREVAPELRVLALHDPLDELAHVPARPRHDVLGDLLPVELAVEVGGAAHLRDPLVDRDAAHLRRPRGDDPLPADAALHGPRYLLDLPRHQVHQRSHARDLHAPEAERVEEHPHPGPVGQVADRPREQRDGGQAYRVDLHRAPPGRSCRRPAKTICPRRGAGPGTSACG